MLNRDYGYCTGVDCAIKEKCKRYDTKAIESNVPLWWTDGFYDKSTSTCDFMDLKQTTNGNEQNNNS